MMDYPTGQEGPEGDDEGEYQGDPFEVCFFFLLSLDVRLGLAPL